jgi:hypothetical protein
MMKKATFDMETANETGINTGTIVAARISAGLCWQGQNASQVKQK